MGFFGPGGLSSGDGGSSLNPDLVKALQAQFPSLSPQAPQAQSLASMGYSFPGVQLYQGQGTGNFASLSPFESAGGASPESITGGLAMGTFGKSSSQTPAGQPTQGLGSLSLPSLNLPMAQVASAQAASSGQGAGGPDAGTGLGQTGAPSGGIGLNDVLGAGNQALNYLTSQGQTTGPQTPGLAEQRAGERTDYTNATGSPGGIPQGFNLGALAPTLQPTQSLPAGTTFSTDVSGYGVMNPTLQPQYSLPSDTTFSMPGSGTTMLAPGGSAQTALGAGSGGGGPLGAVPGSTDWTGVGQGAVGALGGLLNTVGGIQSGNIAGAGMGGLQTIGGLTQALQSSPQLLNAIANEIGVTGQGLSSGLGVAGGGVGAVGGLYSLYQGIQSGDPMQIVSGLYSAYQGGSMIAGQLMSAAAPSLTTAIASAAPQVAMSIASTFGGEAATAAAQAALQAGATAGEAAGAALSTSVAGIAGAVAPIVMAITAYFSEADARRARQAGYTNNPIAGQLYSNATAGVQGAQKVFDSLAQGGDLSGVDTADLADAMSQMSQGLLPYYATGQGGAGPLRASSTVTGSGLINNTGQGPAAEAAYTQKFTNAQQGLVSIVNELLKRGVPYEEIGKLPVSNDWGLTSNDMSNPASYLYGLNAGKWNAEANKILQQAEASPLLQRTGLNNEMLTYLAPGADSAQTFNPSDWTPQALFAAAPGAAGAAADTVTHAGGLSSAMYGGPIWQALARMGGGTGPGAVGPDIWNAISQHFDPWANARTETPNQILATMGLPVDVTADALAQGAQPGVTNVPGQTYQAPWDSYWQNVINQRSQQMSAQDPTTQALNQYMQQLQGLQGNLGQINQAATQIPTGGMDPNLVAAIQANPAGFAGGNGAFSPTGGGGVDLQALLRQLGYIAA